MQELKRKSEEHQKPVFMTHSISSDDMDDWVSEINQCFNESGCSLKGRFDWSFTAGRAVVRFYGEEELSDGDWIVAESFVRSNIDYHDELYKKYTEKHGFELIPPRYWCKQELERSEKERELRAPLEKERELKLLSETEYLVQADTFQAWKFYKEIMEKSKDFSAMTWEPMGHGYVFHVGELAGYPINVSILWVKVNGCVVAFYEPVSNVVKWDDVDAFVREQVKKARGKDVPKCDLMNMMQCLSYCLRNKRDG